MLYMLLSQAVTVMVTIIQVQDKASLSWAGPRESQLSAGKDGTTDLEKTCHYCKDTGHKLDNCLHLQCKKDFLGHKQSGEGLNWRLLLLGVHRGGAKVDPTVPSSPNTQIDDMFHTLVS